MRLKRGFHALERRFHAFEIIKKKYYLHIIGGSRF